MKRSAVYFPVLVVSLVLLNNSVSIAQDERTFALKGTSELGGSISLQNEVPVSNGKSGSAVTYFHFAPFIGIFVADGFEIGVNPFEISTASYSGSSATQFLVLLAPSYNFRTKGIAYPFVEALIGYASQSGNSSRSGFSWGGRGGVKLAVTDRGLLNFGIQYLEVTLNSSGATTRSGYNNVMISAGFTIWIR